MCVCVCVCVCVRACACACARTHMRACVDGVFDGSGGKLDALHGCLLLFVGGCVCLWSLLMVFGLLGDQHVD